MCGDAHRDREDAVECQMAPEDRKERRICNSRRQSQHLLLSRSYGRLMQTVIDRLARMPLQEWSLFKQGLRVTSPVLCGSEESQQIELVSGQYSVKASS